MTACDPLQVQSLVHTVSAYLWNGQPAEAIRYGQASVNVTRNPLLLQNVGLAMALSDDLQGAREFIRDYMTEAGYANFARAQVAAVAGESEQAASLLEDQLTRFGPDDRFSLVIEALRGDRNEANRLAALIDSKPAGHMTLLQVIYYCTCGAPFDLESTPNFASMLAESGLSWPPSKPYEFPLKDW
jgi:hypothetical protein